MCKEMVPTEKGEFLTRTVCTPQYIHLTYAHNFMIKFTNFIHQDGLVWHIKRSTVRNLF
jgi:hypothetical protein